MKYELLFSGIGGQGIMSLGEIVCSAAIKAGYYVTFVPFYGSEKRGGRTMCNIVISDEMESPIISTAQIMLIMDERSLEDYQHTVSEDGLLVINSSMVESEPVCKCSSIKKIPFYDLAKEAGTTKAANVVALGYVAKLLPMIPYEYIVAELDKFFAAKPKLIPTNREALKKGYEIVG